MHTDREKVIEEAKKFWVNAEKQKQILLKRGETYQKHHHQLISRVPQPDYRQLDVHLRILEEKYLKKTQAVLSHTLLCPMCGDSDRGNKMNGVAWCFNCNVALSYKRESKKGGNVKVIKRSLKDEVKLLTEEVEKWRL